MPDLSGRPDDQYESELTAQLAQLAERIGSWRDLAGSDELIASIIADLEIAHEELRVADEEVRVQHSQLEELLRAQRSDRFWQERLLAVMPAPVIVTDVAGKVLTANTAASALLNVPVLRLLGKPLQAFVHESDRSDLRRCLSSDLTPSASLRVLASVTPREHAPISCEFSGVARAGPSGMVEDVAWVIFSVSPQARAPAELSDAGLALQELLSMPVYTSDRRTLVRRIAEVCASALGVNVSVSITLGEPVEPTDLGFDDAFALTIDGLQITADEGPCQTAWQRRQTVVSPDLQQDDRWPKLARLVKAFGVTSALAVPIAIGDETIGAVNIYSSTPERFDAAAVQVAELLAGGVAAVIHETQQVDELRATKRQLEEALRSRAVIDQAKGIIMNRHSCSAEEAFSHLVHESNTRNLKVRQLAADIVAEVASSPSA
jgi:GAF domain-containing protein